MRFAISIPQVVAGGAFDPAAMRDHLTRAEDLGFESAWTGEQVLGTLPLLSPLETLAYASACAPRIRLGCAMLVGSLHNPVHLAKTIASVDNLSRGRLEVGLVTGGPFRMFSAFDADAADYVGDGFMGAGSSTTEQFARLAAITRDELRRHGRDPAGFTVAKRVYVAIEDDAGSARADIAEALEHRYGYFGLTGLAPVAVADTAGDCVAGLRAVAAAGAELILLNPLYDDLRQMRRLAGEVLPHLS